MVKNKNVLFVLPCMKGGGAERVAILLANQLYKEGIATSVLLTSPTQEVIVRTDLDNSIPLKMLSEISLKENKIKKVERNCSRIISSAFCKVYEKMKKPVPAKLAYFSFYSQYGVEITKLRSILEQDENLCIISFLQPSIPISVLAARNLPNKIIISERGNPARVLCKRYGWKFVERYYQRADAAVFQTPYAQNEYPEVIRLKGIVIPNPIKPDLPSPYIGERNKCITTFCRISPDKDLDILIEAYSLLHKEYPEYQLKIIGDAILENEKILADQLKKQAISLGLKNVIEFKPFSTNVHEEILHDTMYVNCSETEGLSNAMLESMAIGLPVICTDCPIGGAKATIENEKNGLLIPMKDSEALYKAMKKIIDDPEFALSISKNAISLRENLSIHLVAKKWLELL